MADLVVGLDEGTKGANIRLSFADVRDLKLGDLDRDFLHVVVCRDVREWQLQGIRFQITKIEYEGFSFFCAAFTAAA